MHLPKMPGAIRMVRQGLRAMAIGTVLVTLAACTDDSPSAGKSAAIAAAPVTPEQVGEIVHVCSSCHGIGGVSISPTFPNLAGQRPDYIEVQLKAFRDRGRADPHARTFMWGMAAPLPDPMIHAIALYYAAQPPAPGMPSDTAEIAAGQKIFREGLPDSCDYCHGKSAEGDKKIPRLAGQHRDYLVAQLNNFASNKRVNKAMRENARSLTEEEIREVTAYIATQ